MKENSKSYDIFNLPTNMFRVGKKKKSLKDLVYTYKESKLGSDFDPIAKKIHPYIYKFLSKTIAIKEDCEDIISIVMESIFLKIDMFDPDKSDFCTWVCAIAKHAASDYMKEKKKFNSIYSYRYEDVYDSSISKANVDEDLKGVSTIGDTSSCYTNNLFLEKDREEYFECACNICENAMTEIPPKCCTILIDKYVDGKTFKEISDDRSINMSTVRVIARRSLSTLKEKIESKNPTIYDTLKEMNFL